MKAQARTRRALAAQPPPRVVVDRGISDTPEIVKELRTRLAGLLGDDDLWIRSAG